MAQDKPKTEYTFVVGEDPVSPSAAVPEPILKSPRLAAGVLAAVILLGSLFGVRRSLRRAAARVSEEFYAAQGTEYGIAADLDKISEFAGNLVTVASRYGDAFQAEAQAVTQARTALAQAQGAGESYAANQALTAAAEALSAAMAQGSLSESDEQYRSELAASILSRNTIIAHEAADYNALVRDYNQDVLGAFPANVLGPLVGAAPLEEYS